MKSLAVAQPKKVLTSPFSQTLEQIAPTWPPFDPQSQKYMALGKEKDITLCALFRNKMRFALYLML